AGERVLQVRIGLLVGDNGDGGANLARHFRQRRRVAPGGDGLDPVAAAIAPDQIDRRGADRSGRAENADAAHACCRLLAHNARSLCDVHHISRPSAALLKPWWTRPIRQAATAAAQNPSSRSMTPPWPGMRWLASLAPK